MILQMESTLLQTLGVLLAVDTMHSSLILKYRDSMFRSSIMYQSEFRLNRSESLGFLKVPFFASLTISGKISPCHVTVYPQQFHVENLESQGVFTLGV